MGKKEKIKGRGRQHLLTTEEVCEYYRITRQTLYNWRKMGLPTEVQFQRKLLFSIRKVNNWMNKYGKATV